MFHLRRWIALVWLGAASAHALPPLQLYVELTPPGGELRPPPGRYAGPVILNRPITLDGAGQVTVDGGGAGTVLSVLADGCIVRGLHLTGSGNSHDQVDAGVLVEASDTLVEDNQIDEVLFGVHLRKADRNQVRANRIRSRSAIPSLRGDGLRLWYSHDNLVEDNDFREVRDLFVANSSGNRFRNNRIRDRRIGLELVFSPETEIQGNLIEAGGTGILVLYSDEVSLRGNRIRDLRNPAGFALSIKESSSVLIRDNEVQHCAVGLSANAPLFPESRLDMEGNRFAYNDVALYFYGEKGGHRIHGNRFENNLTDVRVSAATTGVDNAWSDNHWDRYEGLDLDRDGVGDTPYELYLYSERIWMDRPTAQFFRGSPLLEIIDFIERLTAFSPPRLVLRDQTPRVR